MSNSKIPHFTAKQLDWDAYVKKFGDKPRTTDETYTPKNVYEAVYNWVDKHFYPLKGKKVVRPFFPGGNYAKDLEKYTKNTIVLDNPPFSQVTKIIDAYKAKGVKFFLFMSKESICHVLARGLGVIYLRPNITYENGTEVATHFVHNLYAEPSLIVSRELDEAILATKTPKKERKVYKIPPEIICIKTLRHWAKHRAKPNDVVVLKNPRKVKVRDKAGASVDIYGGAIRVDNKVKFGAELREQKGLDLVLAKE